MFRSSARLIQKVRIDYDAELYEVSGISDDDKKSVEDLNGSESSILLVEVKE